MAHKTAIGRLTLVIVLFAVLATTVGIFSRAGDGASSYQSIRGETITIYGQGLYKHMSADVAIQGIAQDYVTLLVGVPLLLIGLFFSRKGSLSGKLLLTGTLLYFTLTYLFYLAMGMYNEMFLVYVVLLSCSLFALILNLISFDYDSASRLFQNLKAIRFASYFLLVNGSLIALLWLNVVVPPLLNGSVYPKELNHYTTLIVQGFDLAIFLPMGLVSAILALRKIPAGTIFTTIYIVFLAILMVALSAKVCFMAQAGQNVIPVIFIMPTIAVMAIILSIVLLTNAKIVTMQSQTKK